MNRAALLLFLLITTGCQYLPELESDWEPFDDARDLSSRDQAVWSINAILLTDGEIVDFVRGPCRLPRFHEQGIAYRAKEGETTETTLERGQIRGVRIGWGSSFSDSYKRRNPPPVPVRAGAVPGFR